MLALEKPFIGPFTVNVMRLVRPSASIVPVAIEVPNRRIGVLTVCARLTVYTMSLARLALLTSVTVMRNVPGCEGLPAQFVADAHAALGALLASRTTIVQFMLIVERV